MDVSPALNPWLLPALILVPFFGGLLAWYAERWSLTWPRWIGSNCPIRRRGSAHAPPPNPLS